MNDGGNTLSDLAGLALAATVFATSWPAARRQLKLWTCQQGIKAGLSLLLCIVIAMLWIPFAEMLTPRNAVGPVPSSAAAGFVLGMLGWIAFSILWLVRYWVRVLPTDAGTPKQPKWLKQFGMADVLFLAVATVGTGILLTACYG